ncbi:C3 and PZP-like alpha-2-macroglobulin domain-containing protein 8 [Operophtera brumata]|uniref:C3 and PZP-like alpha-2-macroglobulin domain-containing protein 8 n=1 Tax=Operophtera brumata TaxID=104452 RepID=A0A0L7LSQ6_OPEBR|nr:C3 and PZP-like alpha-2-macroglobulin domain-containing protein 8 [Operophtera brumata]
MEQYVAGVRVLLTACARGALAEGEAAARFLYYRASTLQRHPSLAYSATKAAAQYAALAHDRHRSLTVSLATAGMELTDTLELRAKTPPRPLQLPGLPTKVFVYATGAGCATVQGTISYSTYTPKPENALLNIQAAIIEEIRPERSSIEDLQGNLPTLIIKTCFKWKGKERSGILRLESSLFSGYELHSVNPVVLDGATFADLHYGSRGESVWFVFANISSTCPVCVTYEIRSKFVITSLRPAFAKIYPSTRPDMAVETFFHARPGSPLLRGITDDDFITWFDKTELASLKTNANIDNICECGRICSRDYEFRKPHVNKDDVTTEQNDIDTSTSANEEKTTITDYTTSDTTKLTTRVALTNTEQHETAAKPVTEIHENTVSAEVTTISVLNNITKVKLGSTIMPNMTSPEGAMIDDPIIIPTVTYKNKTDVKEMSNNIETLPPKANGELIVQKSIIIKTTPKKENQKKKSLIRRKGTLKATYGDKHDKLFFLAQDIASTSVSTSTPKNIEISSTQMTLSHKENKKAIIHKVFSNETDEIFISNTLKNASPTNQSESNIISTTTDLTHFDKVDFDKTTNSIEPHSVAHSGTSTLAHTITTITKNNIKSMHYRTKKPKTISQIKKPPLTHAVEKEINKTDGIIFDIENNKTKKKVKYAVEKYTVKTLKSINKEIHKIPPTPISETSKSLAEPPKSDIAPENKGNFEILDKNNLGWELLKEGPDVDVTKIDDKLQNRLNLLQSVSNITENENRSL